MNSSNAPIGMHYSPLPIDFWRIKQSMHVVNTLNITSWQPHSTVRKLSIPDHRCSRRNICCVFGAWLFRQNVPSTKSCIESSEQTDLLTLTLVAHLRSVHHMVLLAPLFSITWTLFSPHSNKMKRHVGTETIIEQHNWARAYFGHTTELEKSFIYFSKREKDDKK